MYRIRRGLDLPVAGKPDQSISEAPEVSTVALVGDDYIGMKPTMAVKEGDRVKLGQLLFTDKKTPGVRYTSPGAGVVEAVRRGAKRKFEALVIKLEGDEAEEFETLAEADLGAEAVRERLVASGLWTMLRTRPFNKVPAPETTPSSIFVTAMDSHPLAGDPAPVIAEHSEDFVLGLKALKTLTEGSVFVCARSGSEVPGGDVEGVRVEEFAGPHPSGLPGTHIHLLDPVHEEKTVWFLGCQDVIACGHLLRTGKLSVERVVSLAGPLVEKPRLVRTRLGACLDELTEGQLKDGDRRIVSGSVLGGRTAGEPVNFLGRYHVQVSVLEEGHQRELLGWALPGLKRYSAHALFGLLWSDKEKAMTTSTRGSLRAMVPIGAYEKLLPFETEPTFLLRALITGDTERAQALGCLELDEEDLALCTYICPSKNDYGPLLRTSLETIEKEG